MNLEPIKRIAEKVYSQAATEHICRELPGIIARYQYPTQQAAYSERDAILITYGDMVTSPNEKPLRTLHHFLKRYAHSAVNTIHILPFFPYSSDEGFSVIDYKTVNPDLGDWGDVQALSQDFSLMFDLVANHTSVECAWFQGFLDGKEQYRDYYISIPPNSDTRSVFRPRTSPLLTPFKTAQGTRYIWTTFSADQVDLNYKDPQVLLEMIDIMLFYASQSARYIRLDAIAYIWKELGTACIHLPQAHHIIQIMRLVLDIVSPGLKLITETNVPHKGNVSYFGSGDNEAQLVYNFSLPPLTLHAFHSGNSEVFTQWAAGLETPTDTTAFFNFLASHDGIGITPAHGILPHEMIAEIAGRVEAAGGYVSYKTNPDGSESAYEFNINYFDALINPDSTESCDLQVRRFTTAHAIMTALKGIPGIYFHSLFGSTSWFEGAKQSGTPRTINRERLQLNFLEQELADMDTVRSRIFNALKHLLEVRSQHRAFHPVAPQTVPMLNPSIITIIRRDPDHDEIIICLHNIVPQHIQITLHTAPDLPESAIESARAIYHNSENSHDLSNGVITLFPFETVWLALNLN
jgi:sucrose phosphorylase